METTNVYCIACRRPLADDECSTCTACQERRKAKAASKRRQLAARQAPTAPRIAGYHDWTIGFHNVPALAGD